jgi:hypothetical protein
LVKNGCESAGAEFAAIRHSSSDGAAGSPLAAPRDPAIALLRAQVAWNLKMRILTLDLGSRVGWCLGDTRDGLPAKFGSYIQPKIEISKRMRGLERWLIEKIHSSACDRVYFEKPILPEKTSFDAVAALAGMAVIVGLAGDKTNTPVFAMQMQTWRSEFDVPQRAPRSIAKPDERRKWVKAQTLAKCVSMGLNISDNDAADACGIWFAVKARSGRKIASHEFDFLEI